MRKQQDSRTSGEKVQAATKTDLARVTENDLLDELAARVPEFVKDSDVTPSRLRARLRKDNRIVSQSWAQRWLDKEADEGRLVKVPVILPKGGKGFAYRKPMV